MRIPRSVASALTVAALAVALAGCTPGEVTPPSASPTVDESSPSPTASETAEAPVDDEPAGPTLGADDYANIAESISSGNTAAIEGYLANPVNFIIAATECCGPLTPIEAIAGLDYAADAAGPWTYPVPEAVVDGYRGGFYVSYFPEGAFVMKSADADPYVISFTVEGDKIIGIFIGGGESLLAP